MKKPVTWEETSGYRNLAASILHEAVIVWNNQEGVTYNENSRELGFADARSDVLEFFSSDWCLYLLLFLGIEPASFFRRLGLTKLEKCGISDDNTVA